MNSAAAPSGIAQSQQQVILQFARSTAECGPWRAFRAGNIFPLGIDPTHCLRGANYGWADEPLQAAGEGGEHHPVEGGYQCRRH